LLIFSIARVWWHPWIICQCWVLQHNLYDDIKYHTYSETYFQLRISSNVWSIIPYCAISVAKVSDFSLVFQVAKFSKVFWIFQVQLYTCEPLPIFLISFVDGPCLFFVNAKFCNTANTMISNIIGMLVFVHKDLPTSSCCYIDELMFRSTVCQNCSQSQPCLPKV